MSARQLIERAQANITNLIRVGVILFFLVLALWALYLNFRWGESAWIISNSDWGRFLALSLVSVGPELAGIVIGVVTIDYLNERRQDEQFKQQLKHQLKRDLLSSVTDFAVRAVDELRYYGWLDEVLEEVKANLNRAPLEGASLSHVDLKGAMLWFAHLEGADLSHAHLEGAKLRDAHLEMALLWGADLERADLSHAHLEGADMSSANLKGVNLRGAKLKGANMFEVNLDGAEYWTIEQLSKAAIVEGALMPDGTRINGYHYPDAPTFEEWAMNQESPPKSPLSGAARLVYKRGIMLSNEEE